VRENGSRRNAAAALREEAAAGRTVVPLTFATSRRLRVTSGR